MVGYPTGAVDRLMAGDRGAADRLTLMTGGQGVRLSDA
jgi:hypothetical protein